MKTYNRHQCHIVYFRDKAVAVSYPLKSGVWVTQKRASYIYCLISLILFLANLSFITLSGVLPAYNHQKYCGLTKDSLIVDILTASILPISKYFISY